MVLRTASGAIHRHLNNNTPVNTEVLWGGGLWWGSLRTSAPTAHHVQQVLDVNDTVAVRVACTWSGAVVAQATVAKPGASQLSALRFGQSGAARCDAACT